MGSHTGGVETSGSVPVRAGVGGRWSSRLKKYGPGGGPLGASRKIEPEETYAIVYSGQGLSREFHFQEFLLAVSGEGTETSPTQWGMRPLVLSGDGVGSPGGHVSDHQRPY